MKTVGLVEKIRIIGKKSVETFALFDSGARQTSVDIKLAAKAQLGPIIRTTKIRNPGMKHVIRRPIVRAKIKILGKVFDTEVNIQDRSHMSFPVIIGRNILTGNFVVDTEKNHNIYERMVKK